MIEKSNTAPDHIPDHSIDHELAASMDPQGQISQQQPSSPSSMPFETTHNGISSRTSGAQHISTKAEASNIIGSSRSSYECVKTPSSDASVGGQLQPRSPDELASASTSRPQSHGVEEHLNTLNPYLGHEEANTEHCRHSPDADTMKIPVVRTSGNKPVLTIPDSPPISPTSAQQHTSNQQHHISTPSTHASRPKSNISYQPPPNYLTQSTTHQHFLIHLQSPTGSPLSLSTPSTSPPLNFGTSIPILLHPALISKTPPVELEFAILRHLQDSVDSCAGPRVNRVRVLEVTVLWLHSALPLTVWNRTTDRVVREYAKLRGVDGLVVRVDVRVRGVEDDGKGSVWISTFGGNVSPKGDREGGGGGKAAREVFGLRRKFGRSRGGKRGSGGSDVAEAIDGPDKDRMTNVSWIHYDTSDEDDAYTVKYDGLDMVKRPQQQ